MEQDTTDSITVVEPDGVEIDRELDSQGRFFVGREHAKRRVRVVWKFLDDGPPGDESEGGGDD